MTEPRDYTQWTYADHLAQAEKLAATADDMASAERPRTVAALHREEIRQTTGRGLLHARIAELKKPGPVIESTLDLAEPVAVPEPAATTTARRRERNGGA